MFSEKRFNFEAVHLPGERLRNTPQKDRDEDDYELHREGLGLTTQQGFFHSFTSQACNERGLVLHWATTDLSNCGLAARSPVHKLEMIAASFLLA